jgi:hypothetical protein
MRLVHVLKIVCYCRFCMVFTEIPNMSEPNPEYLTKMVWYISIQFVQYSAYACTKQPAALLCEG